MRLGNIWSLLSLVVLASACGGGGGSSGNSHALGGNVSSGSMYVAGTYAPSTQFKGLCAAPRTGNSKDRLGTTLDEELWLRSWTNELYLWYSEVADTNPAGYTTADYFNVLKTMQKTASGSDKDKFHFTDDTADYESFSQSGTTFGYGLDLELIKSTPPRQGFVGFTEPGSPAANANIPRGAEFITVDGADFKTGSATTLNAGLFPSKAGESHTIVFHYPGAASNTTVVLVSSSVTSTPVQNVKKITVGADSVGYMQFNDHIATSEQQLVNAIQSLQGVKDLILDIRYNGGGYLDIASELAYMIAGNNSLGHFFEKIQFNAKYPTTDPVTGEALTPTPFENKAPGIPGGVAAGTALPTLNLKSVYVLTGSGTCSASESIINGLRGAGVNVVQIGSTTCGKPYGFYPQDNCGTTYFSIEFRGINDAGFGDYSDGFSPNNTTASPKGVLLPGCAVADDFNHALGDPAEARLAAALAYRTGGPASCPTPSNLTLDLGDATVQSALSQDVNDVLVAKSPVRENRWYRQ